MASNCALFAAFRTFKFTELCVATNGTQCNCMCTANRSKIAAHQNPKRSKHLRSVFVRLNNCPRCYWYSFSISIYSEKIMFWILRWLQSHQAQSARSLAQFYRMRRALMGEFVIPTAAAATMSSIDRISAETVRAVTVYINHMDSVIWSEFWKWQNRILSRRVYRR